MKTITVQMADALGGEEVEGVRLDITGALPDFHSMLPHDDFMAKVGAHYDAQAEAVADALRALPQGTRHRLLIRLLREHENLYRGSM